MKTRVSGALLTMFDRAEGPLTGHLQDLIRKLILDGVVAENERLPSTRALAQDLGISRDTVESAYQQLDVEGLVVRKTGSGTFVARFENVGVLRQARGRRSRTERRGMAPKQFSLSARGKDIEIAGGVIDQTSIHPFVAAMPDIDAFPIDTWQRMSARVLRDGGKNLLMYGDAQGFAPLRVEIWRHLSARRGVLCEPEQIVILSSSQQALTLVATVLLDPGDVIAVENPGYHGAKLAFLAAGCFLKPVDVDAEGVVVQDIHDMRDAVRAAYITPSHQYPTGVTLSSERRLALLEWAQKSGAWIIEDDYDSEYHYDGVPVASVQGIDRETRVIYLGTFNKVLFPSLRLAFLVLPKALVKPFVAARTLLDGQSPIMTQAVLYEFMKQGHFSAHIRQMRQLYHTRRDLFVANLLSALGGYVNITSPSGGLSLACFLKHGISQDTTARIARGQGIELPTLSRLYLGGQGSDGWFLGFAALPPATAVGAMRKLAHALDEYYKA